MAGKDPLGNIVTGQLDKLPPLPQTSVKIFVCANLGEFDLERAFLTREVLPELQHQCLQHGLDVMFVDMLLGNAVDPALSHQVLDARMVELDACCEESVGAFFICFVGEEYGKVPLPSNLDDNEFRHIRDEALEGGKNVKLLDHWYQIDENAIPPLYTLKKPNDNTRNQSDDGHEAWEKVYVELLDLIQTAATVCHREGRINQFYDKRQDRFFTSAFEKEIRHALKASPKRCLFVYRDLKDPRIDKKATGRSFLASLTHTIKEIPKKNDRINRLKDEILVRTSESNRLLVSMFKKDGTLSAKDGMSNTDYIARFCSSVADRLTEMIDIGLVSQKPQPELKHREFSSAESHVHLHHCAKLHSEMSVMNENVLSLLQVQLIQGSRSEHQLTIVKCLPDYCKESLTAKVCYRARELFGKEAVLMPIFIGLTVSACTLENIFRRICAQLNLLLKQNPEPPAMDLKKLSNCFYGLMHRVSKNSRHYVVVLDGLEKLHINSEFVAATVDWLSSKFPPKFHVIVTCSSSEESPLLKRLEGKLSSTDNIVNAGSVGSEDCQNILSQTLSQCKRKLTNEQHSSLMKVIAAERSPFIVTTLSVIAKSWSSNDTPNNKSLPSNIDEVVAQSLSSLEKRFGSTVVRAVCAYLTLARYGLTEVELLDALSCNDEVLGACYPGGVTEPVRFPVASWVFIKQHLAPLLSYRHDHGKLLFTWGFRCCAKIVRQRYLTSSEDTLKFHGELADIFMETWTNGKPLADSDNTESNQEDTDRIVSPQPLLYSETKYNMRRIRELWYHLLKAGEVKALKTLTLCNFEYLLAMADSCSIREVMSAIDVVRPLLVDADIHLVSLTLNSAFHVLLMSPMLLANELIGRLRQVKDFSSKYIEFLVAQGMEWCDSYSQPLLVPLTSWLGHVHKPFVASVSRLSDISCMVPLPNGQHVILAQGNMLFMYHIASKTKVRYFTGQRGIVTCMGLSDSKWQLFSGSTDNCVSLWNLATGEIMQTFRTYDATPTYVTTFKDHVMCGLMNGEIVLSNIMTGKLRETLTGHTKSITGLKLNATNTILVSSSVDRKIILWYTEDWSKLIVISESLKSPVSCLDVSCDKTFILAGCDDGSLHVLSLTTGTLAQTIKGFNSKIQSVVICKDCHHCVASAANGSVYLYNFRSTELLDRFEGHTSAVHSLHLSEDQQLVYTSSKDEVYVWSCLKRFTKETYSDCHSGEVRCLAVTKDNKRLITGGMDGFLKSWNLDVSDFGDNFVGHTGPITCLALSDDKTFIVSGSVDTTLKVWSLIMASVITNYKGHTSEVCGVHVLSANGVILSLEVDRKIHMWRPEDGQTVRLYEGPVNLHTPSTDGTYFISGAGDHSSSSKLRKFKKQYMECDRVQLWNLTDGSFVKEFSHTDKISCVSCSSDNMYLVTGALDHSVKVWEMATGKIVQIVVEHEATIRSLVMTKDDEYLLSGDEDGVIMVCSLTLGTAEHKLVGHQDVVSVVKLSDDDAIAVSGSFDHTIRIWGYKAGVQLTLFDIHSAVLDIAMTTTADRIAVRMASSHHVPILCLHNTPSRHRHGSKESLVKPESIITPDESECSVLPIKPRPPTRTRLSSVLPIPPARRRLSSVSSIPQIIQHSPIKAPVQSIINAQEKKRQDKTNFKKRKPAKPKPNIAVTVDERASSVCHIL